MPTIIITSMSPSDLACAAIEQANKATDEIIRLKSAPFVAGETQLDRALAVARQAFMLAEAWLVIDTVCAHESPPSASPPSDAQGCVSEGTN